MSSRALRITIPGLLATLLALRPAPARADASYEHVVASFDWLGTLGGRYGATLELVVSPHDALTLSAWTAEGSSSGSHGLLSGILGGDSTTYDVQTRAEGAGLQYRFYTLPRGRPSRGAHGVFLAPGVQLASFRTQGLGCTRTDDHDNSSSTTTCSPRVRQVWTYVAPSLDVGGQAILRYGVTVGASAGAHYRFVADGDLDERMMPFVWSASHGSGLRPRFRAWIGWAFL